MPTMSAPPAYASVVTAQPAPVNSGYTPAPSALGDTSVPTYNATAVYPQPGNAPQGAFPSQSPPGYQPSKQAPAPPMAGAYPAQGYHVGPTQVSPSPPMAGQTVFLMQNRGFGTVPRTMQCQYCQATVTTELKYTIGGLTWAVSGVLCFVGCVLGCCLIPFCISGLHDVEHLCPNCNSMLGVHRRL